MRRFRLAVLCMLVVFAGALFPGVASADAAADEFVVLKNDTGSCLDLDGVGGYYILHWACNGQSNQTWKLTWHPNSNIVEIKPLNQQHKCATVETIHNLFVVISDCHLGANQRWRATEHAGGSYTFQPLSPEGRCLDADGTGHHALAWSCHGGANQRWRMIHQ